MCMPLTRLMACTTYTAPRYGHQRPPADSIIEKRLSQWAVRHGGA